MKKNSIENMIMKKKKTLHMDFGFSYNGKEWTLEIYKFDIKEGGNVVYNHCYE